MKVTIHMSDRGTVTISTMDDENVAKLIEGFQDSFDRVFTVALNGDAVTHISGRHIVRIDLDSEDAS